MSDQKSKIDETTPGETADESGATTTKVDEKVQEDAAEERSENVGYD